MNIDLEQSAPLRRRQVHPSGSIDSDSSITRHPVPPLRLSAHHPFNILKRTAIISGTLYAMHEVKVFQNILHSTKVSHEWFKVGLASSIAIMAVKAYVELYEGKKRNIKVEYENFKTETHLTILLIMVSWVSFHMSLSPLYGGLKTWFIMIGFGYGVLIQSSLMIPVWGQNLISVVALTFFLQQYK